MDVGRSKKIHLLSDISKKKHKGCMTVVNESKKSIEGKYLINKFCIGVKEKRKKRVNKSILHRRERKKELIKVFCKK